MGEAEVLVFSTPSCPVCRRAADAIASHGVACRLLDVTTDGEAMAMLVRIAGRAVVPTIVVYGEVMVGFDAARLEEMLDGVEERAKVAHRDQAAEEQQLRESEEFVRNLPPADGFGID